MINNIPREGELIEEYLKYHDNFQMQNGSTTSQISNLSKSHISTLHSFSGSISPCNKKEIIASIPVIRRRYDSEDSGDSESELENYSKRSSPNFNSKSCNSEELLSLPEAFPQIKTDSPPAHNNTKNSSQTDKSGFLASDKVVEAELDTSNPTSVDSVVKQENPTLAEAMAHRQKILQQQHYPQNQPRGSQPFICPPPPIKASARLHLPEQLIFKFLGEDVVVKKPPFNRIGGTYVIQFKVNKSKYFMGRLCPDVVAVGDIVIVGLHGLRGIDCGVVAEVNCPPVKQQCKAATAADTSDKNNIIRKANKNEILSLKMKAQDEAFALQYATHLAYIYGEQVTILEAEFQFDRRKLTFFFAAHESYIYSNEFIYNLAVKFECHISFERPKV